MAAVTLNISVSQEQAAWVRSRKESGNFVSASDVVRDLIRREREKELAAIESEFARMDQRDGADGPEPVEEIVTAVRKVRERLLKSYAPDRCA